MMPNRHFQTHVLALKVIDSHRTCRQEKVQGHHEYAINFRRVGRQAYALGHDANKGADINAPARLPPWQSALDRHQSRIQIDLFLTFPQSRSHQIDIPRFPSATWESHLITVTGEMSGAPGKHDFRIGVRGDSNQYSGFQSCRRSWRNIRQGPEPEFDRCRWVDYWRPVKEVIYFKRPVYVSMLTELAVLAFPAGAPPYPEWWESESAVPVED